MGALARAARPEARLLLLIVSEQFRPDYLMRWQHLFVGSGFRRLLDEGAVYLDCRHLASTFASSALATLSTGCYPAAHGIVADHWYDPPSRERVRATPALLEATTFGAEIARRGGRIYAIGANAEHAALLGGPQARQIFSMDERGQMIAEPGDLPWLETFQRTHDPEQVRDARWLAIGATAGAPPLRVLRYDPAQPEDFLLLFRASPFAQAAHFDLVRELVENERLGRGEALDCVAVVLESTARLGYETGANSPLMQQLVLHLDRHIEATLGYLAQAVGPENLAVVFTSAHGAASITGERRAISGEAVARRINSLLGGDAVERYVYPFLYLRAGPRHRDGRVAAGRAALRVPGVAGYYTADGECSHSGEWRRRFEYSFHARRAGDVMLLYAPEYMEQYGSNRGISYGSFYNYDAQVPLIFWGPQFQSATMDRTVEPVDAVPTLASAFELPLPSSSTGRVLADAFAAPPAKNQK
jgi:hypothetical protein